MSDANPYQAPRAKVADRLDDSEEHQDVNVWSASGRIGRARYIAWTTLSTMAVYLVLGIVTAVIAGAGGFALIPFLALIAGIAFFVFQIMLTIQRCHDFDITGWLTLIIIIPLVVFVFWAVPGTDGANRWGPKTKPNSTGVVVGAWLGAVVIPVVIGILAAIAIPSYQNYVKRARAAQERMQQQQPRLPAPEQR
jgi:uncharacterized membrane protein YhaH (DUF805 family)